jgi:hypothetical protein
MASYPFIWWMDATSTDSTGFDMISCTIFSLGKNPVSVS